MRLITAASYDDLTRHMLEWLSKFNSTEVRALFGEDASRAKLLSYIDTHRDSMLLVFYGHGVPAAFLTAAHLGSEPVEQDKAYFCKATDFKDSSNVHILAYCCSAAANFGKEIRKAGGDSKFIGYRYEIPFSTAPLEVDAFERPLDGTVNELLGNGEIDDDVGDRLVRDYRKEHASWLSGEYSTEDRAMMVCMFLEEHMRALDTL